MRTDDIKWIMSQVVHNPVKEIKWIAREIKHNPIQWVLHRVVWSTSPNSKLHIWAYGRLLSMWRR